MNKRKKDILTIVVILIVLLLASGAYFLKSQNKIEETKSPSTEKAGEFVVKTEQDDTEKDGASDTFSDKTTTQNQTTDAGVKGKSGILDIITSENNQENNGDTENEELIWLPGVW